MTTAEGQRVHSADTKAVRLLPRIATAVCGLAMVVFGVWALRWPISFAALIDFPPYNEHLLHDVGTFQIGIGASLLLALVCPDALTVALGGFIVAGGLHTFNHGIDLPLGGHPSDPWALGALVVVAAIGLATQPRRSRPRTAGHEPQR